MMNIISPDIMSKLVKDCSHPNWTTWNFNFGKGYEAVHIVLYPTGESYHLWVNRDASGIKYDTLEEAVEAMYAIAILQQK